MAKTHTLRQVVPFALSVLAFLCAVVLYFALHPPLPSYMNVPPGSQVLVSRRLNLLQMGGPDYYCRIHLPLDAWKTAYYMSQQGPDPQRALAASPPGRSVRERMGGWGLRRSGSCISLDYLSPSMSNQSWPVMCVWPERQGSTIEFYLESRWP